jgi:hypothetical protein
VAYFERHSAVKIVDMEYFNSILQSYPAKSKATSNARDVALSAKELSMGITKLSGSRPFLNVRIETPKAKKIIAATAITLARSRTGMRLKKAENEKMPCIERARIAKTTNIMIEAAQALKMFLAWFRMEENEGLSKPRASFVVAVEPTTEPTSPTMSIKAG